MATRSNLSHLTFFEHLDELRKKILIALGAVLIGTVIAYLWADALLAFLLKPLLPVIGQVYFFSPAEAFIVKIKVAFLAGLFLACPVVLGQLWSFVAPGLRPQEKNAVLPVVLLTSFLFVAGAVFCYTLVLPVGLQFLVGMQSEVLKPMISADQYLNFLSGMLLAFGAAFNIPVFVMAFVFMRLVDSAAIIRYWKHATVLIVIAAAVLTPGPDIASQLMLAVPMMALFVLGVAGAKVIESFR